MRQFLLNLSPSHLPCKNREYPLNPEGSTRQRLHDSYTSPVELHCKSHCEGAMPSDCNAVKPKACLLVNKLCPNYVRPRSLAPPAFMQVCEYFISFNILLKQPKTASSSKMSTPRNSERQLFPAELSYYPNLNQVELERLVL